MRQNHHVQKNDIFRCTQSSSSISGSLVKPNLDGNTLLAFWKMMHLILFCDDDIWAVPMRSDLTPGCLLCIIKHIALQNSPFVWLGHLVQKPYSFRSCKDERSGIQIPLLMKAFMHTKKLVRSPTTQCDMQIASQHDNHIQVHFVLAVMYDDHEHNQ